VKEAGPQLTSLSLAVMGSHIAASWLTHLSGLRTLEARAVACRTMATASFSHMTVCALHVHNKLDAPVCQHIADCLPGYDVVLAA
jgi:hypothetical protein